jgi:hypothetical protein
VAQAGNELTAQFAARLGIDGRVDGFVRNVLGESVGYIRLSVPDICWGDHFHSSKVRTTRQQTLCRQSLLGRRPALRRATLSVLAGTDA